MTKPDFVLAAREASGDRWAAMDAEARGAAVLDAKQAWVDERLGPEVESPTFAAWIAAQPTEVQDDVLGARRARRMRAGKRVERYVDAGRKLTLDELEARRPEALTRRAT